jgi:HK97 family phage prohead protease
VTKTLEQRKAELPKREVRTVTVGKLEVRSEGDVDAGTPLVISGYAAVFGAEYYYGGTSADDCYFVESIAKGAFAKSIQDGDVRLLAEHEGLPLARSRAGEGTLTLTEDDHGLLIEAELDPSNPKVQEIRSALSRGDLDGMSFGFSCVRDTWDETEAGVATRLIQEVRLYECSLVTFPAYEATEVGLRSLFDERLATAVQEARAGKVLSAANAQLIKTALEALTELKQHLDAGDDDAAAADEVSSDERSAEQPNESRKAFAQYQRELELLELSRRR